MSKNEIYFNRHTILSAEENTTDMTDKMMIIILKQLATRFQMHPKLITYTEPFINFL